MVHLTKYFFIVNLFLISTISFGQSGELRITVLEKATMEPVPNAHITVFENSIVLHELTTDSLGQANVEKVPVTTIDIFCEDSTHQKDERRGIMIRDGKVSFVDFLLLNKWK